MAGVQQTRWGRDLSTSVKGSEGTVGVTAAVSVPEDWDTLCAAMVRSRSCDRVALALQR